MQEFEKFTRFNVELSSGKMVTIDGPEAITLAEFINNNWPSVGSWVMLPDGKMAIPGNAIVMITGVTLSKGPVGEDGFIPGGIIRGPIDV